MELETESSNWTISIVKPGDLIIVSDKQTRKEIFSLILTDFETLCEHGMLFVIFLDKTERYCADYMKLREFLSDRGIIAKNTQDSADLSLRNQMSLQWDAVTKLTTLVERVIATK